MSIEASLREFYRRYRSDHARQREQLLSRISEMSVGEPIAFEAVRDRTEQRRRRFAYRVAAAAAVLALVLSSLLMFQPGVQPVGTNAAWASALEQVGCVQSVHLRVSTYMDGPGHASSVEMWWRRPNDFRMEFANNGLVITGNQEKRCHYSPQDHSLIKYKTKEPGFEMVILGEFGELFNSQHSLTRSWVNDEYLRSQEQVVFRGEDCRKLTFVRGNRCYECIVDAKGSLIYQGKIYERGEPAKLLQFIEIIDIDTAMPDRLFTVESDGQMKVKDLR